MKFNLFIAASIVAALTLWMVIGQATESDAPAADDQIESGAAAESKTPSVRYRDSQAEPFEAKLTLRGKTQAARSSVLNAEVDGPVREIVAQRGAAVAKGDVLIRLDPRSLPEQLAAIEALVQQRELEHEAAKKLQASGYQSETRAAETASQLAAARQELSATRIALANTEIKAPYDGVFNERLVQEGEFVAVGDPVATFLELNPMIVTAEATEAEMRRIRPGSPAVARIGEKEIPGEIRYLSQAGDANVRTYTVELSFDNADYAYRAGLTADIVITTESQMAHKVSPALLFLSSNTEGDLGIKTIESDGTIGFYKTSVLGSGNDGVWISGLPETARIITVGQGFVKPGSPVRGVDETAIQ